MTGLDLNLGHRVHAGGLQTGQPFERLDVQHAGVVHRGGNEDSRELRGGDRAGGSPISTAVTGSLVVAALEHGDRHILVWRVRLHVLIHLRVMQRVSPFVPFGDGQRQVRVKNGGQRVHERHIRLNTGVAFGRHIGNRAHQQAASGSAVGHGAPSISQMRLLQRACGVHEVLKGMLLVQSAPLLIPGASHFAAATNMRHGVQHTAIQHAQTRDREPRIGGNLVCTISGNEHRRILRRAIAVPDEGNRNAFAVARGNPHTAFHVIAWIEVAQHDGSLQQRIFTGGGIDFVQLARAGVAGERVAHARRLIRGVAADADGVQAPGLTGQVVVAGTIGR